MWTSLVGKWREKVSPFLSGSSLYSQKIKSNSQPGNFPGSYLLSTSFLERFSNSINNGINLFFFQIFKIVFVN